MEVWSKSRPGPESRALSLSTKSSRFRTGPSASSGSPFVVFCRPMSYAVGDTGVDGRTWCHRPAGPQFLRGDFLFNLGRLALNADPGQPHSSWKLPEAGVCSCNITGLSCQVLVRVDCCCFDIFTTGRPRSVLAVAP